MAVEMLLRIVTIRHNHIERVLNKKWYVLPPIGVPQNLPNNIENQKESNNHSYRIYDSKLGWNIGNNGKNPPLYYSSPQGFRTTKGFYNANREVVTSADIITIGNSFTHGDEVLFEQSWPYYLSVLSNRSVINLGVGGYGIDQAILSYLYTDIDCDTVILGLISGDFERATNIVYGGLYFGGTKTKPMFVFTSDGKDSIINQPCIYGNKLKNEFIKGENSNLFQNEKAFHPLIFRNQLFDFSYLYRLAKMFWLRSIISKKPIYISTDSRYEYIKNVLLQFSSIAENKGDVPLVVLLGNANSFNDRKGNIYNWRKMETDLLGLGILSINTADSLYQIYINDPKKIINEYGLHYTDFANKMVAELINKHLIINN